MSFGHKKGLPRVFGTALITLALNRQGYGRRKEASFLGLLRYQYNRPGSGDNLYTAAIRHHRNHAHSCRQV